MPICLAVFFRLKSFRSKFLSADRVDRLATYLFVTLFFFCALAPGWGEVNVRGEIDSVISVAGSTSPDIDWAVIGGGEVSLDVQATGNRFVRGRFTLTAALPVTRRGADVRFEIERAFIKARFPFFDERFFNVTIGKTRLTWGDGAFYNAGDIIFGSGASNPDFTDSTIRDENIFLLSALFPLGDLTFLEPIFIPPDINILFEGGVPTVNISPAETLAAGLRINADIGEIKTQAGYLYRGIETRDSAGAERLALTHQPFVSLQWNLLVDMQLSSTIAIDQTLSGDSLNEDILASWLISYGFFHIFALPSDASISLRLESLFRPGGVWEQRHPLESDEYYGVNIFFETVFSFSPSFNITLRSLFSPIDLSALVAPGLVWAPYNGMRLFFFPLIEMGERGDIYSWEQENGLTFSAGVTFIF